jgi:hypothetical protein
MLVSYASVSFTNIGMVLTDLKLCLNESQLARIKNSKTHMQNYVKCLTQVNYAMASVTQLTGNLTELSKTAENSSDCEFLKYKVDDQLVRLASINMSNLAAISNETIDGVKGLLPGLKTELIDCKYFGNNLGVIKDAFMQQQELESIVSDVSNVEYLIPLQSQITSINSSLTNVLNSPSLNPKQKTIFMLKITQSTIDQIKNYVNVSKSNSVVTLNYDLNANDFQNMTNAAMIPNIVYDNFFSCITQYLTFSPFDNPYNVSKCLEGVDAMTNTSLNYDQLKLIVANSQAMVGQLNNEIDLTLHSGLSFVETHFNLISCYYTRIYKIWEKNAKLIGKTFEFFGPFFRVLFARCYGCLFLANRNASKVDQQKVVDCLKSCMVTAKVLTENNRKDTENFITEYNAVSKTTYDNITNCVASLRSTIL